MTTMTAISGHGISHRFRAHTSARPARQPARTTRTARDAILADLRRAAPAAGVAVRFALALVPVSALAGMFVWL